MRYLLACLLVLIAGVPNAVSAGAMQNAACEDVVTYFARVDMAVGESMAALDEQPGFREAFASVAETGSPGFLALPEEEQAALLAYLRMPGEALAGIDEDEIPDYVVDLHASAESYWTLMPEMMQTVADEGPSAAMPFVEDLDRASRANVEAQAALAGACPDEVNEWANSYRQGVASPEARPMNAWDRYDAGDVDGLGYPILFFGADDEDVVATPSAVIPATTRQRR